MPSSSDRNRNNVRMGVFVSLSLLLAIGVVVALTDAMAFLRGGSSEHVVRFTVESGVSNLKPGSDVRVGGMSLGQVTSIVPVYGSQGDPFQFIDVHFKLDQNVHLFSNARILVTSPLIGAEAWLDIPSVGGGELADGRLTGSDRIGMLNALLGDEGALRAQQMLHDSQQFTTFLASARDEYEGNIMPILENLRASSEDARNLVQTVREENWPQWANSVDSMLLWANMSTGRFDALLDEGHGLLTDGREVIADNRGDLRDFTDNMVTASQNWRRAAERINTETIDRVHALLDTGHAGLHEATGALQTLRADYDGWATSIGEALGRANLAAQQLNLTMVEVRRSPWKVLYRPSEKELEHELLYEAARSFAVAAADLKAASVSVQRVLDNHGERLNADEGLLERVTRNLVEPLEKYELAQQRLLDVLFEQR